MPSNTSSSLYNLFVILTGYVSNLTKSFFIIKIYDLQNNNKKMVMYMKMLLIKQIQISTLTANILKNTELLILYPSKSHNIYVKL